MKIIKKVQKIRLANGVLFTRELYTDDSVNWISGGMPIDETTAARLDKEYNALPAYHRQNAN